jgi:hypothetical protein
VPLPLRGASISVAGVCVISVTQTAVVMSFSVTARTKGNEILFGIISQPAARADVVDLKISRRAAIPAAPPIARQHLAGELAIGVGFKAQSGPLRRD